MSVKFFILVSSCLALINQTFSQYIVNNSTVGACICVTSGSCSLASGVGSANDGSGNIDLRIINNPTPSSPSSTPTLTAISSGITPVIAHQNYCPSGLERCCPPSGYSCGLKYPPVAGSLAPSQGQAAFGEYPWQAVILTTSEVFQGSGALIDHFHILTVAHKVSTFINNPQLIKIRLGEWDSSGTSEPIPAQEFYISRIFIHPQYTSANLKNDVAILRLYNAVPLGQIPTIGTVCLPSNGISNARCRVAGWGRNDFNTNTGLYQTIMREVFVPIVDNDQCQNQLRATRLGSSFSLDSTSFMCAGGEAGKDACTGDGGSPLVCQVSGKTYVMGLVAWGIGCGTTNVPGVYVNVAHYINWIQQTTRSF